MNLVSFLAEFDKIAGRYSWGLRKIDGEYSAILTNTGLTPPEALARTKGKRYSEHSSFSACGVIGLGPDLSTLVSETCEGRACEPELRKSLLRMCNLNEDGTILEKPREMANVVCGKRRFSFAIDDDVMDLLERNLALIGDKVPSEYVNEVLRNALLDELFTEKV